MSMLLGTWRGLLGQERYDFVPSDVLQIEANALIRFYNATAGAAWTSDTNWLTDPVVNNWQGVTVVGGHVTQIDLNTNNLVGAAGNTLAPLAAWLTNLNVSTNALTSIDLSMMKLTSVANVADNGMSEAAVDAVLLGIYNWRIAFNDLTPALDIGGTNAAPGGVYQYSATPSTGNEYRYKLVNDDDGDGDYYVWGITV